MRATFACLLLLPVLATCSARPADSDPGNPADAAAPAPGGTQMKAEITARRLQGGDDGGGRVAAQGGHGRVAVQGTLSTPNPCYTFNAAVRRDGAILTLTVEARSTEGMCIQSIGAFAYDATVSGVAPGRYTFRVVHTYPGTGWESRGALETPLTVD
jgi:hypothetical protein